MSALEQENISSPNQTLDELFSPEFWGLVGDLDYHTPPDGSRSAKSSEHRGAGWDCLRKVYLDYFNGTAEAQIIEDQFNPLGCPAGTVLLYDRFVYCVDNRFQDAKGRARIFKKGEQSTANFLFGCSALDFFMQGQLNERSVTEIDRSRPHIEEEYIDDVAIQGYAEKSHGRLGADVRRSIIRTIADSSVFGPGHLPDIGFQITREAGFAVIVEGTSNGNIIATADFINLDHNLKSATKYLGSINHTFHTPMRVGQTVRSSQIRFDQPTEMIEKLNQLVVFDGAVETYQQSLRDRSWSHRVVGALDYIGRHHPRYLSRQPSFRKPDEDQESSE